MGGIGKTELALQYAHFHLKQKTYKGGICWLDCRGKNIGLQIITFAISRFNLQISEQYDLQTRIQVCWDNWPQGDALIIFDDVVDYKEIKDCIPPESPRFKAIITTRQKWLEQSFEKLELEVLDTLSAIDLLISFVGSSRIEAERKEAEELCKDLGFLPLGLELVARYLERKPNLSLAKTRQRLGLKHKSLEQFSEDMTAQRGVIAAFELSWNELDKDKLINFSLLQDVGGSNYGLHPLIRQYFRNKLAEFDSSAEDMKHSICKVVAESTEAIPESITIQQVNEVEIYIPHVVEVAENLHEYLSDDDLITPFVRLGSFYKGQGLYPQAQPWLEKAKEIAEQRFGDEHPDVANSLNNLALLYKYQGRYDEAETLFLQALDMKKKLLGDEHPDVASSLNNLAYLYNAQGRYDEAEPLNLQALDMYKKLLGDEHPDVAISLNNLAGLYNAQGRYDEAETLLLQALDMKKKLLGDEHPNVATSLHNLAHLYRDQGRYDEAETLFLQALDMKKKLLGDEHPNVATSLNNLAGLYRDQGRYDEAETLYLQALDMRKKLLGDEHPSVATTLHNLALLYNNQGRYDEAESLYLQALDMRKKLLGEEHPDVATSLNNLAVLYDYQGRYDEAEPLYLQASDMRKKLLGDEHPYTQGTQRSYQALLEQKKKLP
jgi:tetratricopeptide (TPR) repeat protein